jgi:hypothetical protein
LDPIWGRAETEGMSINQIYILHIFIFQAQEELDGLPDPNHFK